MSRGPWRSASTIEPRLGCEVSPLIESIAPSTASAPASTAASTLAAAMPLVSCVWKWIGSPISSLQRLHQRVRRARLAQPRHVLDAEHVRARRLQFAARAARSTAGRTWSRADRRDCPCSRSPPRTACPLSRTASIATRMFSTQLSESKTRNRSMPLAPPAATKYCTTLSGIVRVADRVRRAQQHLQQKVRHRLAKLVQSLPRALLQKPHRDVERRAAPALDRQQIRQQARVVRARSPTMSCVRMRVASSDWCASRMRRIGDQHALLRAASTAANFSAPSSSSFCFVPGGGGGRSTSGSFGVDEPRAGARVPSLRDCR